MWWGLSVGLLLTFLKIARLVHLLTRLIGRIWAGLRQAFLMLGFLIILNQCMSCLLQHGGLSLLSSLCIALVLLMLVLLDVLVLVDLAALFEFLSDFLVLYDFADECPRHCPIYILSL
jgi:hypothetical protein